MAGPWEQYQSQPTAPSAPVAPAGPWTQYQTPSGGGTEIPGPRRSWGDVAYEAVYNLPSSAGRFVKGLYEAVSSPVQTARSIVDVGAGALQNVLPKAVKEFVDQFDTNPEAAQRAVAAANAVGGIYKERYGSIEGFKNALATDPVAVAADVSTLLSGGSTATAQIAPRTSALLSKAAAVINPMTPVVKAAEFGLARGAQAVGGAVDMMQGQGPTMRAAGLLRAAVTEEGRSPQNLLAARTALQNAPAGATARQALADVSAPSAQYLGQIIEARAPGAADVVQQAQQAERLRRLAAVTPDEAAAVQARGAVTQPLYQTAYQATVPVTPQMATLFEQMPKGTLEKAANIARMEGRPFVMGQTAPAQQVPTGLLNASGQPIMTTAPAQTAQITGESLHYIKRALSDIVNAPESVTGIGRDARRAAQGVLSRFLTEVESQVPVYGTARSTFAQMSEPVNQAQVLNAMVARLQSPMGVSERPAAFMNVLGQGEQALLKRATGYPRYTELSDVLTPPQMGAVRTTADELRRAAEVERQTSLGRQALDAIIASNKAKRIPNFFSVKVTLANETIKLLEGRMNKNTLSVLEEGFKSAKSLDELLGKVPARDRSEVLRALGQAQGQLSPTKLNILTQVQNALAPQSQNQNALAAP